MRKFKTPEVADMLDVRYWILHELFRARRISRPLKDFSGDYSWSEENIAEARAMLNSRRRYANKQMVTAAEWPSAGEMADAER